jgi:hypothetical protein
LIAHRKGAGDHCVHCRAQVSSGDILAVAWPGTVELAVIDKLAVGIEQKEIGRAGGTVGLGNILRRVLQIGERVTVLFDFLTDTLQRFLWMGGRIIAVDRDDLQPLLRIRARTARTPREGELRRDND